MIRRLEQWARAARGRLSRGQRQGKTKPVAVAILLIVAPLCSAQSFPADATASPFAKVQPPGLREVQWTTGFWANRLETCRQRTIPWLWSVMGSTNYTQFYENFRIAAGLAQGRHRGASFNDGDFYKWMEAASASLAISPDAELERRLDEIIGVIAQAQRADGYLHTPVLIAERNHADEPRALHDPLQFEMYNMGHLLTAACVHYRATGHTNLLAVARKTADFFDRTFADPTPELACNAICPSHYMGMVELFRTTREPRYLTLAQKLLAVRNLVTNGTDDNQDRVPFLQQTNAMGHAVRANYLYAGATDLFLEIGDAQLWSPLDKIWPDLVRRKLYITGGCGALYDGASPDATRDQKSIARVHQAYGRAYELPNLTAHNETCADIANVLWNWRMFLATGEARFIDVLETSLYNSVLSGMSLDGTNFFYVNPLRTDDPLPLDLRWPHHRVPFMSTFCCPPNLARTIAESATYAYAKSNDSICLNLYGSSRFSTTLNVGREPNRSETVSLRQETDYPWNGRIRITIESCGDDPFALKLRIPGWARAATIRIDDKQSDLRVTPSSYIELRRQWRAGTTIDFDLPMPPQLIEANPQVEEDRNQVAIRRGPLVYCLESVDLTPPTRPAQVAIPADIDLVARFDQRLLGGTVVLEGTARERTAPPWDGELYRDLQPAPFKPVKLRLIPYFAWANRGPGDMSVWLPLTQ